MKQPDVLAALIATKITVDLAVEGLEVVNSGATVNLEVRPSELAKETLNPIVDALNISIDAINEILPGDQFDLDRLNSFTTPAIEADADALLAAMADTYGEILHAIVRIANLPQDIVKATFADSNGNVDLDLTASVDVLEDLVTAVDDGLNDGINSLPSIGVSIDTEFGSFGRSVSIRGPVRDGLSPVFDQIDTLLDGVREAQDDVDVLADFVESVINLDTATPVNSAIDAALDAFVTYASDLVRGFDLDITYGLDLFDVRYDVGLDLIQEVSFDPSKVDVTYELGGESATVGLDDPVRFFANGAPGQEVDGTATYDLSGAVDFEYRLALDYQPVYKIYGLTFDGSATLGDGSASFSEDYALIEITDSLDLDDVVNGSVDPAELFDDALLELPFGFLEDLVDVLGEALAPVTQQLTPFADQPDLHADRWQPE